jgi:hypothetical protein
MSKKHYGKQTGRPVTHEIPTPAGGVRLETFVPWRLVKRGVQEADHHAIWMRRRIATTPDESPCAPALGDAGRHHGRGRSAAPTGAGVRIRPAHCLVGANAQGSRLKQDELSSPVVGGLVPVVIRLAGPARRMTTGTKRGGIRMTFHGPPGPKCEIDAP